MRIREQPEPVILLCSIGIGFHLVLFHAFVLFRICCADHRDRRLLNDTCPEDCWLLAMNNSGKDEIQAEASRFGIYGQLTSTIPAIFSSLYLAVWSDKYGRKLPLIISSFGLAFHGAIVTVLSANERLPLWIILVSNAVVGFSGFYVVFFASCFAMIIDTAVNKDLLTIKMGIASSLISFGTLLGSLAAGELAKSGFFYNFLVAFAISTSCFLYSALILLNSRVPRLELVPNSTGENSNHDVSSYSCVNIFLNFFSVVTVERRGKGRIYLLVALICILLTLTCDTGGLQYFRLTNAPFYLSQTDYSYQVAVQTFSGACGLLLIPYFLKRILKLINDLWLITFSVLVAIFKNVLFAFATHQWMIFAFSALSSGSAVFLMAYKSFCSKLVEKDESGRLMALIALIEVITPLTTSVFNLTYSYSLRVFIGLTWILAAIILLAVMLLTSWLIFDKTWTSETHGAPNSDLE